MTIDISKIRNGDTVSLGPFKVLNYEPTFGGVIHVEIDGMAFRFTDNLIASHTPKPRELKIGDRVFVDKERTPRVIGAVFMDVALLDVAGSPMAFNIRRLKLADPNQ